VFAKILAVILCLGACACILLAARHARIRAAHDLAEARLRIVRSDQELWRLRAEIAGHVTPARVERLAAALTPLRPIVPETRMAADTRLAHSQERAR
jgi:hypothetical protein